MSESLSVRTGMRRFHGLRRAFDIVLSAVGLIAAAPLFALIGALVLIDSGWPILFRQTRAGRGLRPFTMLKFRTMRMRRGGGPLTPAGDAAVARTGAFLRATKLDELPQLWNVLSGDMSIIGPRPEVFDFVDRRRVEFQRLLRVRPGLVDPASIAYFDEGELLANYLDPVAGYEREILPRKLELSAEYQRGRNFRSDFRLVRRAAGLCARKLAKRVGLKASVVARMANIAPSLQGGDFEKS
jgi:lipopolysaccharide/colanic/teichoic acid biosynthesis glycosyltransferase